MENDGQSHSHAYPQRSSKPEAERMSPAPQEEYRLGDMKDQAPKSETLSRRPDSHGVSKPNTTTCKPGQFKGDSKGSTKQTRNQAGKAIQKAVEPHQHSKTIQPSKGSYKPGQFKDQNQAASKPSGSVDKAPYQPGQFNQTRRNIPQAFRDSIQNIENSVVRGATRARTPKSNLHSQEDYKQALDDDEVSFLSNDASLVNKKGNDKSRSAKTARERADRNMCCASVTPLRLLVLSMSVATAVAIGILYVAVFSKNNSSAPVEPQSTFDIVLPDSDNNMSQKIQELVGDQALEGLQLPLELADTESSRLRLPHDVVWNSGNGTACLNLGNECVSLDKTKEPTEDDNMHVYSGPSQIRFVSGISPKDQQDQRWQVVTKISTFQVRTKGSPQKLAADWITNYDVLRLAADDPRFIPRYVLAVLYYAMDGDNWHGAGSWLGSHDACLWHGVCCLDEGLQECIMPRDLSYDWKYIIRLDNNNLSGQIPDEIGEISGLIQLELQNNSIRGTLPDSIGSLKNLLLLDASSNAISGTLSDNLGDASNLVALNLHYNDIGGALPNNFDQLHQLKYLDIGSNEISGTLPSSLGRVISLEHLKLDTNSMWGTLPGSLYDLRNLKELILHENMLTGSLAGPMENMLSLTTLSLYENELTGSIPSALGLCRSLNTLAFHNNLLRGSIPPQLGSLTSLERLFLDSNDLTGTLPEQLWNAESLQYFDAYDNKLTGEIPAAYNLLSKLRGLNLRENKLEGPFPLSFRKFQRLEDLDLGNNGLSGSVHPGFFHLKTLVNLDVHSNNLQGSLPADVELPLLQYIDLENNAFSGTIPETLTLSEKLKEVYLRHNNFSGAIGGGVCSELVGVELWADCAKPHQVECTCCTKCD